MKWTFSIKNKFLVSLVLLALCLLVLLSNYLDRLHTTNVENSIVSLYEDRLIAEGYILKMTGNIYQIREVLNSDSNHVMKSNTISNRLEDFKESYNAYIKTKLTTTERSIAIELISSVKNFEQNFLNTTYNPGNYTAEALFALDKLSTVQIEESKLIMKEVESEHANLKASSQFSFAIVIIILLGLQAMVFSAKTIIPIIKPKDPSLN